MSDFASAVADAMRRLRALNLTSEQVTELAALLAPEGITSQHTTDAARAWFTSMAAEWTAEDNPAVYTAYEALSLRHVFGSDRSERAMERRVGFEPLRRAMTDAYEGR